ncbi:LD-carboxypeptidase [Candidatus Woesearchaeota archaeon]|nr:LD-carboxypeptidase [Candidatus Woesearchaeota archaeon]
MSIIVPHRLEKGIKFFEKQGYKVKIFPTTRSRKGLSSDTPENRAKDINEAFKDKNDILPK